MLRIGYFGDGPWAREAFKRIVDDHTLTISFVTVRYNSQDVELINLAKQFGIAVELSNDINSDEFFERIYRYNVDLIVSMSFDQIFRQRLLQLPRLGAINCHAGKLPYYRGRNILNWALINDESEFGITVHYIDEGIDTGDIIGQKCYPITDDDDYSTLLKRAYIGCADVLIEGIKKIQLGTAERVAQNSIDPIGMYCGIRGAGDEIINWNQSSRRIFNFVRAICSPGPKATTFLRGKELKVNKVREIKGARTYFNTPGQVLGKTANGFYVKTGDTFIEVIDYEYEGIIKTGDRLG